jgi:hypothetical protein
VYFFDSEAKKSSLSVKYENEEVHISQLLLHDHHNIELKISFLSPAFIILTFCRPVICRAFINQTYQIQLPTSSTIKSTVTVAAAVLTSVSHTNPRPRLKHQQPRPHARNRVHLPRLRRQA